MEVDKQLHQYNQLINSIENRIKAISKRKKSRQKTNLPLKSRPTTKESLSWVISPKNATGNQFDLQKDLSQMSISTKFFIDDKQRKSKNTNSCCFSLEELTKVVKETVRQEIDARIFGIKEQLFFEFKEKLEFLINQNTNILHKKVNSFEENMFYIEDKLSKRISELVNPKTEIPKNSDFEFLAKKEIKKEAENKDLLDDRSMKEINQNLRMFNKTLQNSMVVLGNKKVEVPKPKKMTKMKVKKTKKRKAAVQKVPLKQRRRSMDISIDSFSRFSKGNSNLNITAFR